MQRTGHKTIHDLRESEETPPQCAMQLDKLHKLSTRLSYIYHDVYFGRKRILGRDLDISRRSFVRRGSRYVEEVDRFDMSLSYKSTKCLQQYLVNQRTTAGNSIH